MLDSSAYGQLSPGDLQHSHAFLDGVENCTKCHGTDRSLAADKCLACHSAVGQERQSGAGLHGHAEYGQCQKCHVEHQGRTYDLIWWEHGQKGFDHALTGYPLVGKHSSVECRACHQSKFVVIRDKLTIDKRNLDATFQGLSSNCVSCHFDEHRGQVSRTCTDCHNETAWKPAAGFNHGKAKFILTGKHAVVLCAKCHKTVIDNATPDNKGYLQFTGIAHDRCLDCHDDAHKGKLGSNCESCHNSSGWGVTNKANFDHSKTRYPLEGKHLAVACDKCHAPGKARDALKFGACRDCHSDFHKGQLADRSSKGACEECHSVSGYSPARFAIARHDSTDYPLRGAHKAVPCNLCHGPKDGVYVFKFASVRCLVCHTDPHHGELNTFVNDKGCEFCHSDARWADVQFDHSKTKFALDGKHAAVACRACHHSDDPSGAKLTFVGAKTICADCHADPHRGQFASVPTSESGGNGPTDCLRCHTPQNWKAALFDHNTQARFKLDGAHQKVPCQRCHKPTGTGADQYVLYKPLGTSCASCHNATIPTGEKGKS